MLDKNRLVRPCAFLAAFTSVGLTGCASIVNGPDQIIAVETRQKGYIFRPVSGATCELTNPRGTFKVITPGKITVSRAYEDMSIKCEKENFQPGYAAVRSSAAPIAFSNILIGGIVGAGLDLATGAAFDYPAVIKIIMGDAILVPLAADATPPK